MARAAAIDPLGPDTPDEPDLDRSFLAFFAFLLFFPLSMLILDRRESGDSIDAEAAVGDAVRSRETSEPERLRRVPVPLDMMDPERRRSLRSSSCSRNCSRCKFSALATSGRAFIL